MKYSAYFAGLLVMVFLAFSGTALSETVYVKGLMKITVRTGPSTDHKIIAMIASGDSLDVIESRDDWALVRTSDGKEGWVLARFITRDLPIVIIARQLKQENQELSKVLADVKTKNVGLSGALGKTKASLSETQKNLKEVESAYSQLKKESSEFLELKIKHKEISTIYHQQQERVQALEKSLGKEDIIWFVSGAGVFVLGMFLGMSTRKKRKSSLL